MEELSQKLALATQDQDFRQVFEPIEGEVPVLHIHLGGRDSCDGGGCDALSGATFCRKCLATCSNFMVRCLDATINLFVPDPQISIKTPIGNSTMRSRDACS